MLKNERTKMRDKIRFTKLWLTKAEKSFDDKNDLFGELNLLLAEAELKHLSERKQTRQRKLLAFLVAMCLSGVVFGMYSLYDTKVYSKTVIGEKEFSLPVKEVMPAIDTSPVAKIDVKPETKVLNIEKSNVNEVKSVSGITAGVAVTDNEMQEFVRSAGKTLRSK